MTNEINLVIETNKAKKSAIANSAGFAAGVLVTVLTLVSPSPIFLLAWGAIIFCPIGAVRSYRRYNKLKAVIGSQEALGH
jgi:hypothetical protein